MIMIGEFQYSLPKNVCKSFKDAFIYDNYRNWHGRFRIRYLFNALIVPSYSAIVLFRLSHLYDKKFYNCKPTNLLNGILHIKYALMRNICERLNFILNAGVEISVLADINPGLFVHHCQGTIIGGDTRIGMNCHLFKNVLIGVKDGKYPTIKDNVAIYANATILGGITVGNNSVIGPNSVVIHDVPDNTIVAGIPAKVIKKNDVIYKTIDGVPHQVSIKQDKAE